MRSSCMRAFFGCAVPGPRTSTTWPSTSGWTAFATDSRHSTVATKQLLETGTRRGRVARLLSYHIIQQATESEHNALRRRAANRFAAVSHGATMTARGAETDTPIIHAFYQQKSSPRVYMKSSWEFWKLRTDMLFHLVPFGTMLACKPAAGAGAGYKNGTPFTEQYSGRGTEPETTAYGTFDGMRGRVLRRLCRAGRAVLLVGSDGFGDRRLHHDGCRPLSCCSLSAPGWRYERLFKLSTERTHCSALLRIAPYCSALLLPELGRSSADEIAGMEQRGRTENMSQLATAIWLNCTDALSPCLSLTHSFTLSISLPSLPPPPSSLPPSCSVSLLSLSSTALRVRADGIPARLRHRLFSDWWRQRLLHADPRVHPRQGHGCLFVRETGRGTDATLRTRARRYMRTGNCTVLVGRQWCKWPCNLDC